MASETNPTANEPDNEAEKSLRELVVPDAAANVSNKSGDRSPGVDRDATIVKPAVEITENSAVRELIVPELAKSDPEP